MKSKRSNVKKYQKGGRLADLLSTATGIGGVTQAALGGLQTIYGLSQLPRAKREFERARADAPSLETPSQFYENYKNAYDAELARMQSDAIQSNLATSVQALQGAGGRALIGGLGAATIGAQRAQQQMLAGERAARLQAGQQLAAAQDRSIARQEARSIQRQNYANQAYQAALGNIGGGLTAVGKGIAFATQGEDDDGNDNNGKRRNQNNDFEINLNNTSSNTNNNTNTNAAVDYMRSQGIDVGGQNRISFDPIDYYRSQGIDVGGQNQINYNNPPFFNRESGGMMTKGEFSHSTNPIDLVQNGQKVGEATGGEYIINPTQAKKISKESSFARKLFKRFERNARKDK